MNNQEWDIRIPASVVHKGIPHGAMLLYGKLRQMSGSKGHCWPSQGYLAKWQGCCVSSIKKWLKVLAAERLIDIRAASGRAATYFILSPSPATSSRPATGLDAGRNKAFPSRPAAVPEMTPPKRTGQIPRNQSGGKDFSALNRDFEEFYAAYPRKEAKELARAVWHALHRRGELASQTILLEILAKFRASASWQREHGRFVPLPSNWLRGRRWLDEAVQESAECVSPERKSAGIGREAVPPPRGEAEQAAAREYASVFNAFVALFPSEDRRRIRAALIRAKVAGHTFDELLIGARAYADRAIQPPSFDGWFQELWI